jgi:hypothetical protein
VLEMDMPLWGCLGQIVQTAGSTLALICNPFGFNSIGSAPSQGRLQITRPSLAEMAIYSHRILRFPLDRPTLL